MNKVNLPSINIIGAGHLGQTLGRLWVQLHSATIHGVVNKTLTSAKKAVDFIGAGTAYDNLNQLPNADITLITTPDDVIASICRQLTLQHTFKPSAVVLHCSGSLNSNILKVRSTHQVHVASIHPLHSFSNPSVSIKTFVGTPCAMEGDAQALTLLSPLFNAIGAVTFQLNPEHKVVYHAAGVFASNYLVTLFHLATQCLHQAQIDPEQGKKIVSQLMQTTLNNLTGATSVSDALTGPLKRGDSETIKRHLATLPPELVALYKTLSKTTLDKLTHHNQRTHSKLDMLFEAD